jgi:hypothetical protein
MTAKFVVADYHEILKLMRSYPLAPTTDLDSPENSTSRFRRSQRGSDQFRVAVLGDFVELVLGKTKNKTIAVVVSHSELCRVASPRFHHYVVSFCNELEPIQRLRFLLP